MVTLGFITTTSCNLVACNNYQGIKFNYENLITSNNIHVSSIKAQTQDTNGNLYYATFDNPDIGIPGEKIWKYNINTKNNEIYWENQNFKVGSFNMAIDSHGNIYLSSSGGVYILNNKSQSTNMPLVVGAITSMVCYKNYVYIASYDGFYQYNIDTQITKEINLPDNSRANNIFIDKDGNIYLGVYKSTNYGALIIKKGEFEAKPIIGDDFFNSNGASIIAEINNKIYFCSLDYQNKTGKLYYSELDNLNNIKLNYLLDLSSDVDKTFNINNKVGLIIKDNKSTTIQILNINPNVNLEKKYEIKNILYNGNYIIQNFANLYLSNEYRIDCLNW